MKKCKHDFVFDRIITHSESLTYQRIDVKKFLAVEIVKIPQIVKLDVPTIIKYETAIYKCALCKELKIISSKQQY